MNLSAVRTIRAAAVVCLAAWAAPALAAEVRGDSPVSEAVDAPRPEQPAASRQSASTAGRRLPPIPATANPSPASVELLLSRMLPARSDAPADWFAGPDPLHYPCEPRFLVPCIPPAPCHPAYAPYPADLVGVRGSPTCGPRYRGPCEPRLGTHDHAHLPRLHALGDAAFDCFYR